MSRAIRYARVMSTSAVPLHVAVIPLRDLLNSALSSPSGRCVVTDESGVLLGTATDHDVIDAIRRARGVDGGQEHSDRGGIGIPS